MDGRTRSSPHRTAGNENNCRQIQRGDRMKLINRNEWSKKEFRCTLTERLDSLSKMNESKYYDLFYHYILVDRIGIEEKCLAIRVPGGTVGGMWIDENNTITKIHVDTDYVVKTYPNNVNELIQKFVGEVIEYQVGEVNVIKRKCRKDCKDWFVQA